MLLATDPDHRGSRDPSVPIRTLTVVLMARAWPLSDRSSWHCVCNDVPEASPRDQHPRRVAGRIAGCRSDRCRSGRNDLCNRGRQAPPQPLDVVLTAYRATKDCGTRLSMTVRPKPSRRGTSAGGPPCSCHSNWNVRSTPVPLTDHVMLMRPMGTESAPCFDAFVASSCNAIPVFCTASGRKKTLSPCICTRSPSASTNGCNWLLIRFARSAPFHS